MSGNELEGKLKAIMATSCQLYSQVPLATIYTSLIVFSDSQ